MSIINGTAENNTLTGTSAADQIYGLAGDDILEGGLGDDLLDGGSKGKSGDTVSYSTAASAVSVNLQSGAASGGAGNDTLVSIEHIIGSQYNDTLIGDAGANTLNGGDGNDTLDGGTGNDSLDGGSGNDTYLFGIGSGQDTVNDYNANPGNLDTVQLGVGIATTAVTISRDFSNLFITINGTTDKLTLSSWFTSDDYKIEQVKFANGTIWNAATLATKIVATDGDDYLTGDTGANIFSGLKGNDTYVVDNTGDVVNENPNEGTDTAQASISYTLPANVENLTLTGSAAINGTGNELNNTIYGNSADNVLDGGAGNDTLGTGGKGGTDLGNDTYLFGLGGGQDTVYDYDTTPGNLDTVQLGAGIATTAVTISRDTSNLYVKLNGTTDQLTLSNWFTGDDFKIEQVKFADGTIWNAAILVTKIIATDGNDYLAGDTGANILSGLKGNDAYTVDHAGDVVNENPNEGTDTVQASISYTLPANVENLTLMGSAAIKGTGNELNNTIYGNSADNILDGGAGNDTLGTGGKGGTGAGNDTYLFGLGSGQDTVYDYDTTLGNLDTVQLGAGIATTAVTIRRDISNLYIKLNSTTDQLTFSSWFTSNDYKIEQVKFADGTSWDVATLLAKTLFGTDGDDYLPGDSGANNLSGLKGNDTYIVDHAGDVVNENPNEGSDNVQASISYTLADNVENLALTGSAAINGTGNELNNSITGNSADNILDGGSGDDTLGSGSKGGTGAGNDTYLFGLGSGQDTVYDYDITPGNLDTVQLGAGIVTTAVTINRDTSNLYIKLNGTADKLTLSDWFTSDDYKIEQVKFADGTIWNTAALLAHITELATDGDDYFVGDSGANTFSGLKGNDTYVVDHAGDVVNENLNEGFDSVQASISYTLAANVENLALTGSAAINGTGNELNNSITGNSANNILNGGAGNDSLNGGLGSIDPNTGTNTGNGNDTYLFGLGSGQDTVYDYDATPGNLDTVQLGAGIATTDVTISGDTSNLYVKLNGTNDQLTLSNWFTSDDHKIEQVKFADGTIWNTTTLSAAITGLVPTLTAFASTVANGNEDSEIAVTFANLQDKGNEADVDGTVMAFVIKSISSGTLKIGTSAATASAWNVITNNTVDGTHHAYWTPAANANGSLNAFTAVAKDNGGLESSTPIQATIAVIAVNDAPALTAFSATVANGKEDSEIPVTFANLQNQGDEADTDGTVTAFVVKTVSTGTLKIGTSAGTASAWNVTTNNTVDGTHHAYWTPAANDNGSLNAFKAVAKDNGGLESASAIQATIAVTAVNDAPALTAFSATIAKGNEDSVIPVTFANLQNQGDEADTDGTVTAFVVKTVSTGTLKIGTSAGTATAWAAGANNLIDATHLAFWTPATNTNGTLNAFTAVAKDNSGVESAAAIQAKVAVTAINDVHTGAVTLQGSATVGQTLSASHKLADLDGLGAVNYQWQASTNGSNWSAINGATANSLQLTRAQAGQFIRAHASFIDGGGTLESQDSAASNKVIPPSKVISGSHGNDALAGTTADDGINGGFGFDTLRESGVLTDYAISQNGDSVVLTNKLTGERDVLTDIERVTFASGNHLTIAYTEAEAVARHLMTNWLHRDLSADEGAYVLQHLTHSSATDIANVFMTLPEASGLTGKSASELLAGYESSPFMQRLSALREVTGGASNDRGTLPFGIAVDIDGGQGHDVLNLLENRADIGVTVKGGTLELSRHTDGAMLDLRNIEMISLANSETIAIAHDNIEGILGRLIHTFFDRNASVEEWQLGRDALAQHIAPDAILNWFQDHAGLTQLSDSDYIQTLYQNTFDRAATATEQDHYLTQLQNGSLDRSWLAVDLAQSQEAVTVIGSQVLVMDGWI